MTDSSGNSIGTIGYLPFGSARSASGAIPTDKKFTGQRLDGTGLYYFGARYYDPGIGRFISPDTVIPDFGNPQALNRYSYVYNNPLKYNDPSGHFAWLAALAVVNVVVNYAGISYDIYQLAQDPSLANLGWLALDLFDPTPIPHGAVAQGAKALEKAVVKEVAEQAGQEVAERVAKSADEGIVYLRTDLNTGKQYVGQTKSEARYYERQAEHARNNPDADYTFQELGRAEQGIDLDILEQSRLTSMVDQNVTVERLKIGETKSATITGTN